MAFSSPTQDFVVTSGLNVQGTSTVTSSTGNTSTLQVDGGAAVAQNLIVGTTSQLYGDVTAFGNLEVKGNMPYLTVTGTSTFDTVTAGVTTASQLDVTTRLAVGGLSQLNNATLSNSTNSTSSTTGALQVTGGVGIQKDLWIGGTAYVNGYEVLTTASIDVSTFQTVTERGSSTTVAISVLNTASSTSTNTGALQVAGGVGIGGSLYAGSIYDSGNRVITSASIYGSTYIGVSNSSSGTNAVFTITNLGVQTLTAGTDTAVSSSTGTITVWNTSTLQTVTSRGATTDNAVSITNTTNGTGTTTGALIVSGGVGIAQDVYIGGSLNVANTSYINDSRILVAGDLETVITTATFITNDPTSQVGLSTIAGTTTTYGTYNFGTVADIQSINDFNTGTNTGFYSINDASGAPAYVVYIGFSNVTQFSRIVLNINYTANSGHTVEIDLYNYVTSSWDTYTTFSGSTSWYQFILATTEAAAYISSGNVVARIYHVSSGNTAHRTWIDYVALEDSIQGGQGPRGATGATGATGPQGLTTSTTSTFVFFNTAASTATTSANAVYIKGGLGIDKSLLVTGEAIFQNNVTFSGTATYVLTTNTVYTDNIIELHYPNGTSTWAVNDSKDIGLRFHYYDTTDANAFLGRNNATGYLEWLVNAGPDNTDDVTGTYGTFILGSIILTNTTASSSTSTGALTVVGGVGVGGTINAGNMYSGGSLVLTTSNVNSYVTAGVSSIVAGTDTAISSSTGAVTIWNNSTLQTVTSRGSSTSVAINITNTTSSTSTTTGALKVTGGVGIGGSLYAGSIYDTGNRVLTSVTGYGSTYINVSNSLTGTVAVFTVTNLGVTNLTGTTYLAVSTSTGSVTLTNLGVTNLSGTTYLAVSTSTGSVTLTNLGVQTLTAGTDTAVSSSTGTVTVWNTGTLQTVTGRGATTNAAVSITNTTSSTSTATGALTVTGGAGIGGNLYVGGTIYGTVSGNITTATNLAGGTAGQVPYQTGSGATSFYGPGTAGNVLVSNGTSAPTYNSTLTLASTITSISTTTGALQVRGGVGVADSVYVGNRVGFVGTTQASVVYQFYNTLTNSLDTVFG